MGRLNHNKLVWVDGTLIAVPDKNEPIINKELIDWVIREEGFLNEPTDIGDGKITLGSGLTDPRWHKLYNERGGKWSSEDNRRAVAEELAKRNKWAEDSIPNWEYFPNDAKRAMLSYKYNYDFTPSNSPKLFNAMSNLDFLEAVRQMDATSKDPKFRKGLEERRARERAWALKGIEDNFFFNKPEEPVEMPDALTVSNPYESRIDNTIFSNRYVPASNSNYVETVPISREADEDAKVDSIVQNIIAYNNLRNKLSWKNQEPQQYVPTSGINYVAPVSYPEGGELKKRKTWDELSMTERAEMMRVAIENGITTLPEIKKQYNEFAEGGDTEVNDYRSGGKIQIRPENRGKFTRLKERTGHSASWFKAHGTPAQKKMAVFALNSRHWKHALGGPLVDAAMAHFYGGDTEDSQQMNTALPGQEGFVYNGPTYEGVKQLINPALYNEVSKQSAIENNPTKEVVTYIDFDGNTHTAINTQAGVLSPVDPAGELIVGNAVIGPVFSNTVKSGKLLKSKLTKGLKVSNIGSNTKRTYIHPKADNYETDWSPEKWLAQRSGNRYDVKDVQSLTNHVPEYRKIETESKVNGTWLKMPDGSMWKGDPRSWIQLQSKAAQQYNPDVFWTGIDEQVNPTYNGRLWGVFGTGKTPAIQARQYASSDSKVLPMFTSGNAKVTRYNAAGSEWKNINKATVGADGFKGDITTDMLVNSSLRSGDEVVKVYNVVDPGPSFITRDSKYYIPGISNNYRLPQNDIVLKEGVLRKSLLGNNGDFSHVTNIYKGLVPAIITKKLYNE